MNTHVSTTVAPTQDVDTGNRHTDTTMQGMPQKKSNMYKNAKTWNPFKGCTYDCTYCAPSFKGQAKRQKHICKKCYAYAPHYHPEKLRKFPSADTVFVCGNSDISLCNPDFTRQILASIREHSRRCPHKTFYFQSKQPEYFEQFIGELPESVVLLTTLETNRDEGYDLVSKAPLPTERYAQFKALDYPRKVVTVEPIMAFDMDVFFGWLRRLDPEYIWLGFNSRPKQVQIPEPDEAAVQHLVNCLKHAGIPVRGKSLRGVQI